MRNRMYLILTTVAVTLLAGNPGAGSPGEEEAETGKPNFLFIAVDDLNHYTSFLVEQEGSFLSKLYPDKAERARMAQRLTPNLQRLASQSLTFTRAYCPQALCGPSRTALLSGIPPHVSGYYAHEEHFRYNPVLEEVVTLPQYLKANGYATIGLGKIFHKAQVEEKDDGRLHDWPDMRHSWSTWIERRIGVAGPAPAPRVRSPYSPDSGLLVFGTSETPVEQSWDYLNAGFAATLFLEGTASLEDVHGETRLVSLPGDQPFFLACGLFAPHLPWYVPREFYDRFPAGEIQFDEELVNWIRQDIGDLPEMARKRFLGNDFETLYALGENHTTGPDGLRAAVQAYLATIAFSDHCLGQLVDAVEKSPHRDNTVVILWSDHGWHLGDKQRFRKHALWDPATHNVLLVRDPAYPETTRGRRTDEVVSLQSLYPTIANRAGLPVPAHVHGHDLRPLLEDPGTAFNHGAVMTQGEGNHALRTNGWRYIRYRDGGQELYDMRSDPFEYNNLAIDPAFSEHLSAMDAELRRQLRMVPGDYRSHVNPDTK